MSLTQPTLTSAPTVPRWLNHIVIWLLHSPFHPFMSHTTLLLTFPGRKSGHLYTIPVRYLREAETFLIITDSHWWRNLHGGTSVDLYLAGQKVVGKADVSTNPEDVERAITAILRQMPQDARFYQVYLDKHGQPDTKSLQNAAQTNVLITILIEKLPPVQNISHI